MITALIGMTTEPNSRNRMRPLATQRQPDGLRRAFALRDEEVVGGRGAAADLGRDPVARDRRADDRDQVGGRRVWPAASGLIASSRTVEPRTYRSSSGIEPGRSLARRAGRRARRPRPAVSGAPVCRVGDRERALDPVDALDRRRAASRSRSSAAIVVGVGRRALDVGEDHDRRRLARRELGLEGDVRVAALDAGRVDLGARARPARGAGRAARR